MLSKKAPAVFSSCANLAPLCSTSTTPPCPCTWSSCRHRPHVARQARAYAHQVDTDLLSWPDAVKPHLTPTPYQILHCSRGAAYSKTRFLALVKLYHPDRCHLSSPVAHLPRQVRLERYRLLVTAHDILSDTEKRRAYDIWGHGWSGHHKSWEFDQRRWASDPRHNATWEDWERWRHENEGPKEESEAPTIPMSNFAFMSLMLAFVSIGRVVQNTRITTFSSSVMDRRDQIHREASQELRRSQGASISGDQDGRIRTFVEHRDSNMSGEHSYERLLPPVETCAGDVTKTK